MASQGIEHGVIKDKEKVRMCIRSLMSELMKDREIEVMNVVIRDTHTPRTPSFHEQVYRIFTHP